MQIAAAIIVGAIFLARLCKYVYEARQHSQIAAERNRGQQ